MTQCCIVIAFNKKYIGTEWMLWINKDVINPVEVLDNGKMTIL